jgi:predicted methyltransferase
MMRITELAHAILRPTLKAGDWCVDATTGHGHDTLFLAEAVGQTGRVFGFDVQAEALAATTARVLGRPQVTLFPCGHEHMAACLPPDARGRLAAVMFNLGILPGARKAIATRTATTIGALTQALDLIRPGGHITVALYSGHPGGPAEAAAVAALADGLPSTYAGSRVSRLNAARPAPELLIIERIA